MPEKSGKDYLKSRINTNARLYQSDQKKFDLIAREEFNGNEAETVRSLVRKALRHRRLVNSGKDTTMNIGQTSQKKLICDTLHPLINQTDTLQKTIQNLPQRRIRLLKE
jgi:hypothetical protein